MKFTYRYRTSDNVEHCDTVSASDRDAAYRAVKALGRKPSSLNEADGFFNKVFGKGKRWMAIAVLAFIAIVSLCLWRASEKEVVAAKRPLQSTPRHQVYGDPDILASISQDSFASVFEREGDRILALFAQPGNRQFESVVGVVNISDSLSQVLDVDVPVLESDPREVAEIKQIVNGMRQEMRIYLGDGVGTLTSYYVRLRERQEEEARIQERIATELSTETDENVWAAKNASLRRLGLRTIVPSGE